MNRLTRLQNQMAKEGVDLLALAPGSHLRWLLGLTPHADERPFLACITQETASLLVPALEMEALQKQCDLPSYPWSDDDGPVQAFEKLLIDAGVQNAKSIALDECMRADHAALVQDHLPVATRSFSQATVGALRMRKDDGEYTVLKTNAQQADRAMQAAWAAMRPGITEEEVAAVARASFAEDGAHPLFTIVGAGANGAMPHHHTGATVLKDGDAVVMDIGAGFDSYSSDITRMAFVGTPNEEYLKVHAIVEAAVQAAMTAARPGVKAHVVDDAARGVITEAGYGKYFVHRTGHGLGVDVHEPPYISAASDIVLDDGMVFSIEPGIYLPGRFGIRLEEIVILRPDGPETLSDLPRDVRVI